MSAQPRSHPHEIGGHPAIPVYNDLGDVARMITVCGHCGALSTVLFLTKDRWYCSKCRAEGVTPPNLYPVS